MWATPPVVDARMIAALADHDRGEAFAALRMLDAFNDDVVADYSIGARIASIYARLDSPARAVEFQRRAVMLTDESHHAPAR